jgi:hypothetical protein
MNFKVLYSKRNELLNEFKKIFNFIPSWDVGFVLDNNDLSEHLDIPNDKPLQEYILDKYGVEAVHVVEKMNNLSEEFLSVIGSEQREKPKGLLKSAKALKR